MVEVLVVAEVLAAVAVGIGKPKAFAQNNHDDTIIRHFPRYNI